MTKIFRKTCAALLVVALCVCSMIAIPDESEPEVSARTVQTTVEYNPRNNYCYELSEPFAQSPDSFEAWIKMPHGSVGGTIMGNLTMPGTVYGGVVKWLVDCFGRVGVYWNRGEFEYYFNHQPIDDDVWHHVAIVRNEEKRTFILYIDGIACDGVECNTTAATNGRTKMRVGVAHENTSTVKTPFDGHIRQVTVYNGAITRERINEDMYTENITDDNGGKLLGNWYFGDVWTERKVLETCGNGNDASLCTFQKYVGLDTSEFEYDYSIAVLGDIQTIVHYKQQRYFEMCNWIKDNAEDKKISFVTLMGDLSDSGYVAPANAKTGNATYDQNEREYRTAATGLSVLDNKVPYCFVPGNHDYDSLSDVARSQYLYNTYFPYSTHSKLPGFGGAYIEGDMANTYYLFKAGDVDYLVINLEFEPRMPVIRWACRLCEQYPDHRVIVCTHSYMRSSGDISTISNIKGKDENAATYPTELYEHLIQRYENIFMVLCGHIEHDDVVVRYDTGIHGNVITSMLIDPQGIHYDGGIGEDLVFMMQFNEKLKTINCYYYSPYYDAVWNIQNQFRLKF